MQRRTFLAVSIGASGLIASVRMARAAEAQAMTRPDDEVRPDLAGGQITIDNFSFTPASLEVPIGTRVTWTNRDDIPHTIVNRDDPHLMKSGPIDTGESFSFAFARAGTYHYFCSLHPHMQGAVVVR